MPYSFSDCLKIVLQYEGGFTNDPLDPGGATNLGIIQVEYDRYRLGQKKPKQSVLHISHEEAADIYEHKYWNHRAAYLPSPLNLAVFDTAVNFGEGRADQFLMRALGIKNAGTAWTQEASKLVHASTDPKGLAQSIVKQRKAYRYMRVAQRPSQVRFLKGWLRRDSEIGVKCK